MKLPLFVFLILGLAKGGLAFPMCTNGEPPLMERNDAFSCDRGCPMGFICEFQVIQEVSDYFCILFWDSDRRMVNGICCANETALMEIYGDMMQIEPVWSENEDMDTTEAATPHIISPPGLKPPKGITFPPNKDDEEARQYKNPFGITVPPEEGVKTTFSPEPPVPTTIQISKAKFDNSAEKSDEGYLTENAGRGTEMDTSTISSSSEAVLNEPEKIKKIPPVTADETNISREVQALAEKHEESAYEEATVTVATTTLSTMDLEEMNVDSPSGENTATPEESITESDESKAERIEEIESTADSSHNTSSEENNTEETEMTSKQEDDGLIATSPSTTKETIHEPDVVPETMRLEEKLNITLSASQEASESTTIVEDMKEVSDQPEKSSMTVPPKSENITSDFESSEESGDQETVDLLIGDKLDNSTITQENTETTLIISESQNMTEVGNSTELMEHEENQEFYSCDRQIYKFTCHGGRVKTQPTIRWAWNDETNNCEFYPWGYCPGDRVKNSTTIRTKEECLVHCSHRSSKTLADATKTNASQPVQEQVSTYHAKVSFASPRTSISVVRKTTNTGIDQKEAKSDELLPIISTDPALVHIIAVTDPRSEAKSLLNIQEAEELTTLKPTTKPSKNNGRKSGVHVRPDIEESQVLCTETPYRYVCASGMPSQFVYRWQVIDGKCRSFPYGYCWGELNHAHPRSRAECQRYCPAGLPTNYFRVL